MSCKVAFINTEPFWRFDYGAYHPLKIWRFKLTQKLQQAYGLLRDREQGTGDKATTTDPPSLVTCHSPLVTIIEPQMAKDEEVLVFHEPDYLEALRRADEGIWFPELVRYGIGSLDCPLVEGIYEASMLAAGASVQAAELVASREVSIAFNMAGGFHHAKPSHAWGFCYINDPVIAIHKLLQKFERVAYIDIDAHHGDGVQLAFYRNPKVLTISTHENGRYLFPGTGFETEMGEGEGFGFTLNIPFLPYAGDDVYLQAFDEVILPTLDAFKPKAIVTQLGADALSDDPITHWNLTTHSYGYALRSFKALNLPWVALGGGGYNVANVCRAWTLALAVMLGVELPDEIPSEWQPLAREYGVRLSAFREREPTKSSSAVQAGTERVIHRLKQNHPLLTGRWT